MHFVFMGVSGSGKSTVAVEVARRLSLPFAEADAFHPPANIEKMSDGVPLTDTDRSPWLHALADWIGEREGAGEHSAMACSALRRDYRDILRTGAPDVRFVHLHGSVELIAARLRERSGHFMPPDLLASQAATLEPLAADEAGVVLDVDATPAELIDRATAELSAALRARE